MIFSEEKPLEELVEILKPYKRVAIIGCSGCYGIGTAPRVEALAKKLAQNGVQVVAAGSTGRQCSWFWKQQGDKNEVAIITENTKGAGIGISEEALKSADALVSLACGVGVQTLAKASRKPALPATNTRFMGRREEAMFYEQCIACGNCILHLTGGICPIAKCPKSHMNGPCGGVFNGKCEVDRSSDCAWVAIYGRLKSLGNIDYMKKTKPAKDFSIRTHPRKVEAKA